MPIVGSPFLLGSGGQVLDIKSTDAVIRIKAHDTSTVVATKGDVVRRFKIKYKSNDDFTCFYLTIPSNLFDSSNEWVITDTYDNETRSINLLINAAYEFSYVVNYNIPSGYTELEYIGYPTMSAVNTYYFTVPNPFAGFTFSDTFKIISKHYWVGQSETNQGPYGHFSNSEFKLPTLIMGAKNTSDVSRHVLKSIQGAASTTGYNYVSNIGNYNSLHEYTLIGIGQNANDDLIPDWKFNEEHLEVDYDDTLFGLEIDGDDREIHYYLLPNTTTDHDNGLVIDIPFISGVKYTCSCTLTTPTKAWICFRRSDDWGSLLAAPDGWNGVTSGNYTISFTASETIKAGKLIIYTADHPWEEESDFDEVTISNLTLTANTSSLLLSSSYDDGEETTNNFGYTTTLMDTNQETPFYVGQFGEESGYRNFSGRMYGLDIEIDDEKVLSYIPCRRDSDSAVGFYDSIGKQFHQLHV